MRVFIGLFVVTDAHMIIVAAIALNGLAIVTLVIGLAVQHVQRQWTASGP